jgi:hypothetical protein
MTLVLEGNVSWIPAFAGMTGIGRKRIFAA